MRYALISDLHANLEALQTALADIDCRGVKQLVCLGDVVNYGANPIECLDLIRRRTRIILQGNHETALISDELAGQFNPYARAALEWTRKMLPPEEKSALTQLPFIHEEKGWMLVHGTAEDPESFDYLYDSADARRNFRSFQQKLCFYGHTHMPMIFSERTGQGKHLDPGTLDLSGEDRYIINVGSVGQPRDRDPRLGYLIFDDESMQIECVRLSYDVNKAAEKIRKAGLPPFLAERLAVGQ